jgi:hypothetical protein
MLSCRWSVVPVEGAREASWGSLGSFSYGITLQSHRLEVLCVTVTDASLAIAGQAGRRGGGLVGASVRFRPALLGATSSHKGGSHSPDDPAKCLGVV